MTAHTKCLVSSHAGSQIRAHAQGHRRRVSIASADTMETHRPVRFALERLMGKRDKSISTFPQRNHLHLFHRGTGQKETLSTLSRICEECKIVTCRYPLRLTMEKRPLQSSIPNDNVASNYGVSVIAQYI